MSNAISILNDLIETSKDSEKGFRTSAEDTRNGELKSVFVARARDCAKAAADLQQPGWAGIRRVAVASLAPFIGGGSI